MSETATVGMTHKEIVAALSDIFARIGNPEYPWVGFGRVLEAMEDIAQHSGDEMCREAFPSIKQALVDVEEAKGARFQVIDMFDQRTDAEVNKDMGLPDFEAGVPLVKQEVST